MQFYCVYFFFFNDTATTEIYTLSLHDALPISIAAAGGLRHHPGWCWTLRLGEIPAREKIVAAQLDRKSTRLNSSHGYISYAVFCLKKKKKDNNTMRQPHAHRRRRRPRTHAPTS